MWVAPVPRSLESPVFSGRAARIAGALELVPVVAIVVAVWWPFLCSVRVNNGSLDWEFRTNYVGYELHSLWTDHEFPFWVTDPRFEQLRAKGIHDFFANPETDVLSLMTPLAGLFGVLSAVKIALVIYLAAGVVGCRRLLRAFGGRGSPGATLFLALLALCNGAFVAHVLAGHVQFLTAALFPLALAFFVEAWEPQCSMGVRLFRASCAGVVLAIGYYAGNAHLLAHFLIVFVGLFALLSLFFRPRLGAAIPTAMLVALVSFLALSAFKLLPGFADFHEYRTNYLIRFEGWSDLFHDLITPMRSMTGDNPPEHNLYIGWVGIALLAFGLTGWDRRTLPLFVIGAAVPWLTFLEPSSPLLALPFFRTQGGLTRIATSALFAAAIAAAIRVDRLLAWSRRWAGDRVSRGRAICGLGAATSVYLIGGTLAFDLSRRNVADGEAISCVHALPSPPGPFSVAPRFAAEEGSGARVEPTFVGTNEFRYHFSGVPPFHQALLVAPDLATTRRMPHLRLEGVGKLTTRSGVLAVSVDRGEGTFTLRFFDPLVGWGAAISLAAFAGIVATGISLRQGVLRQRKPLPVMSPPPRPFLSMFGTRS